MASRNRELTGSFASLVGASLAADGALTPVQRDRLDHEVDMLWRSIRADLYDVDYTAYSHARELLRIAHHVRIAAGYADTTASTAGPSSSVPSSNGTHRTPP
ncbi:hypothetical protein H4W33_008087 [Kibdelosporangium phytohabitans]|uniref:Uncharacterized protein n=1 Tax=Kibdelosporangium phytohabitans TaxID=860235 RepID=A0A0N9HWH9_9PSEU|nr:hypothetical protein AOZ06_24510 [Kibdelosporangium phytohabitans]MBE1469013.1 hypothetical protein [Kibdelosporangium phytohabitans]